MDPQHPGNLTDDSADKNHHFTAIPGGGKKIEDLAFLREIASFVRVFFFAHMGMKLQARTEWDPDTSALVGCCCHWVFWKLWCYSG